MDEGDEQEHEVPDFDAEEEDGDDRVPTGFGLLGQLIVGVVIVMAVAALLMGAAVVLHRLFG